MLPTQIDQYCFVLCIRQHFFVFEHEKERFYIPCNICPKRIFITFQLQRIYHLYLLSSKIRKQWKTVNFSEKNPALPSIRKFITSKNPLIRIIVIIVKPIILICEPNKQQEFNIAERERSQVFRGTISFRNCYVS